MDSFFHWLNLMFGGTQKIVQSSASVEEGLHQLFEFVKEHPEDYEDKEYWDKASSSQFPIPMITLWAIEGFERLKPYHKESFLFLDCGDGPDDFRLYEARPTPESNINRFLNMAKPLLHFGIGDGLLRFDDYPIAFPDQTIELARHNIRELNHPILSWNMGQSNDSHWPNGELLWLAVASLAFVQPLRDETFCKKILKGRPRMIVVIGFEEVFYYAGTISATGYHF